MEIEKRQPDRGRDRERQGRDRVRQGRDREGRDSEREGNSKSSFYKDCNLGSVKPCLTTSPCRKETERDKGETERSGRDRHRDETARD